jgi:hypothetical protein
LEFLFAGIVALLDTARVATAVWPALLGADPPTTGDLMCWFTTQGPGLNQLVDLTGIRSISGSGGSGAHQRIQEDLPLGGDTDAMAPLEVRRFVAYGILSEALEHSGYRDDDSRLDAIRDDPGRC